MPGPDYDEFAVALTAAHSAEPVAVIHRLAIAQREGAATLDRRTENCA